MGTAFEVQLRAALTCPEGVRPMLFAEDNYLHWLANRMSDFVDVCKLILDKLTHDPLWMLLAGTAVLGFVVLMVLKKKVSD
jgi:hypothetical protein